jgi:hypothetical protein
VAVFVSENGARDGARTRDLRRDRPECSNAESRAVPTFQRQKATRYRVLVGTPVLQRDDGQFQVGMSENAAGPFPTRPFAQAVADSGDDPPDKMRSPAAANGRANRNKQALASAEPAEYYPDELLASAVRNAGKVLAVLPDGIVLGTFKSRLEAAQASGRRS